MQGLEPEMQRLITQHQSELQAVRQQANDATQQRLHELMVQVPHAHRLCSVALGACLGTLCIKTGPASACTVLCTGAPNLSNSSASHLVSTRCSSAAGKARLAETLVSPIIPTPSQVHGLWV